jgi:hypothetical protein
MQAQSGEIAWGHPGFDPEAFDWKTVDLKPKRKRRR